MVDSEAPDTLGEEDMAEPVSRLDLMLDRICLGAVDVSAFLLDATYGDLLSKHEKELRRRLLEARSLAERPQRSPIDERVLGLLSSLDVR